MIASEMHSLELLFAPRAVAVVGASANPDAIGGRPIHYALSRGFRGVVYPVNPARSEVQGLTAYPSLAALPGPIDLAIIAVNADAVSAAVVDAAARGARAVVIFSAGFAEAGSEGARRQAELRAVCRERQVRALGPNCLGSYHGAHAHVATFASCFQEGFPPVGGVALVSQSGAYGSYLMLLATQQGIGISRWVTTGNEMDVNIADVIEHWVAERDVRVIGCVAEGVTDGDRFLTALQHARAAGKPVVLMKLGRTAQGAQAAQSHTAALAVDDAVFDSVTRQAGASRVRTTRQMLDLLYALEIASPLRGPRLGVVTMSGGVGVLLADAAADAGLTLPRLAPAAAAALRASNPLSSADNPIDVTGQALKKPALLGDALRALARQGECDALAAFLMNWPMLPQGGEALRAEIDRALDDVPPGMPVAIIGSTTAPHAQALRARGVLLFDDPDRAITTIAGLAEVGRPWSPEPATAPPEVPLADGSERDEARAKRLLSRLGLRTPEEILAADPERAGAAAAQLGGPVVLKIVSPDLPHKSDVGGVVLGLRGAIEARAAAATMLENVRRRCPNARLEGFLVSAMCTGIEMIIGTHVDKVFGMLTLVGAGGVLVEERRDVAIRRGAVSVGEAARMIGELRCAPLLRGVRGSPPSDVEALATAISQLSHFGVANARTVTAVEVNPVLVRSVGQGCVMLDALLSFSAPPVDSSASVNKPEA